MSSRYIHPAREISVRHGYEKKKHAGRLAHLVDVIDQVLGTEVVTVFGLGPEGRIEISDQKGKAYHPYSTRHGIDTSNISPGGKIIAISANKSAYENLDDYEWAETIKRREHYSEIPRSRTRTYGSHYDVIYQRPDGTTHGLPDTWATPEDRADGSSWMSFGSLHEDLDNFGGGSVPITGFHEADHDGPGSWKVYVCDTTVASNFDAETAAKVAKDLAAAGYTGSHVGPAGRNIRWYVY